MQSVTGLGAYVHIAYLSPVGNLHQVLVLGAYNMSVSDAKQISVRICVRGRGAYCSGRFEKNTFSGMVDIFCPPCMCCAPVHEFRLGSTGGEAVLNAPVMLFHCVLCNSKNGCKGHLHLKESLQ